MGRHRTFSCVFLLFALEWAAAERYDWANRFGGNDSSGYTIGLDGGGNTYVAGYFSGTLAIGTNQLVSVGGWDTFLAKLNPDGNPDGTPIWAVRAGGTNDDWIYRIAVTTNGTVFTCGTLSASATFGTNTLETETNGLSDGGGFVARIDDGFLSWIDLFAPESRGAATGSPFRGKIKRFGSWARMAIKSSSRTTNRMGR
jgi:hypothetical protein